MDNRLSELRKIILFSTFFIFLVMLLLFENSLSLFFYSTIEKIAAEYEAKTGKPHLIHYGVYGNCRIVNLNEVLLSKRKACVVMGELNHENEKYYHLWATENCKDPFDKKSIIDKTKKTKAEIEKDIYIPRVVIHITENCKPVVLWSILDNLSEREKIIYKKFFAYIEEFCKVKKMINSKN